MPLITSRDIVQTVKIILASAIIILGMQAVYAFVGPPGAPADCPSGTPGCDPPLTTSPQFQQKSGPLLLGGVQFLPGGFTLWSQIDSHVSTQAFLGSRSQMIVKESNTDPASAGTLHLTLKGAGSPEILYGRVSGEGSGAIFGLRGGDDRWVVRNQKDVNVTFFHDASNNPRMALDAAGNMSVAGTVSGTQFTGPSTDLACAGGNCVDAGEVNFSYAGSAAKGGPATTAQALSANPANCAAGEFAQGINESGAAECAAVPVPPPAGITPTIFESMYTRESAWGPVTGTTPKDIFCDAGDVRVFCSPAWDDGGDGKTRGFRTEPLAPNGCRGSRSSDENDSWSMVAYCLNIN